MKYFYDGKGGRVKSYNSANRFSEKCLDGNSY